MALLQRTKPELQKSIRSVINETIKEYNDEPDPHIIATNIANDLDMDQLRAAAAELLLPQIREAIRNQRTSSRKIPAFSDRWDSARFAFNILKRREFVSGTWKFLGDCTPDEVFEIAAQHKEEAERNLRRMEEYRRLANVAKKAGVRTLNDLTDDKIASVYVKEFN